MHVELDRFSQHKTEGVIQPLGAGRWSCAQSVIFPVFNPRLFDILWLDDITASRLFLDGQLSARFMTGFIIRRFIASFIQNAF